ncbi:hypothetical protein NA56DRAFT_703401 [Hyaloscypha hepaticicola]|uniref:Mid2 domain-containing protein n=1 Tax=Hyaloscypha hepaticicola TaxID=2082293 RepID=A0A2J6Q6C1_9HELO|nr:hypothetical protein NA56DRAFT_703401 [Hyaloscypha hepaticicola]
MPPKSRLRCFRRKEPRSMIDGVDVIENITSTSSKIALEVETGAKHRFAKAILSLRLARHVQAATASWRYLYLLRRTFLLLSLPLPPPARRAGAWTYEAQHYNNVTGGPLIQNALPNGIDSSYWPPDFADNARGQASEIYSPGYCPSGYTSPVVLPGNGWNFLLHNTDDDQFLPEHYNLCWCVSIYPESDGLTAVRARANDTDLTVTAISGPVTMCGQPIVVEYQQRALTLFSTSTSTSSISSSTASLSPSATTNQPAVTSTGSPTPSKNPKSALSTGARAGIGVGVAIVALILLGIAAFFIRRKRKARQKPKNGLENKVELPVGESKPRELYGDHLFQYDHSKGSTSQGPVSELAA